MMDIWIAPEHIYCDMKGNIVDSSHPDCHKILIGKGDVISMSRAISLGLAEMPEPPKVEVEAGAGPKDEGGKTDYALLTKPELIDILKERNFTEFKPTDKKEVLVTLCERTEPPKEEVEE